MCVYILIIIIIVYMGFHGTVPLSYMEQWDRANRWDLGWLCSVYMRFHGTVPLSYMGQWDRMDRWNLG